MSEAAKTTSARPPGLVSPMEKPARATLFVRALPTALSLVCGGCDRSVGAGSTRLLALHGLAHCPHNGRYERPVVVRVDRDRSIFEEAYTAQVTIEGPSIDGGKSAVTMPISRQRMRVTLRLGLCVATTLGTWDCAAPTWLGSEQLTLDGRDQPQDIDLPRADLPCADGSNGKPPSR